MGKWKLTDDEIEDVLREDICWLECDGRKTWHFIRLDDFKDIAQAQAKELVEWLEDHRYDTDNDYILFEVKQSKWQALRKEVGLEVKDKAKPNKQDKP